jgi:ketosteroid isomerase-like protein
MNVTSEVAGPEAVVRAFSSALRAGDLESASDYMAKDSCLVTPDATIVSGRGAIRGILAQLIAQRPEISIEPGTVLTAGDIAFVAQRWRLRLEASSPPYVQDVNPILVLRREEGDWKLAITAPWRQ